jgi:hypothetical protein
MQESVIGSRRRKKFTSYITDVINAHTPERLTGFDSENNSQWPDAWEGALFGTREWQSGYLYFVACLFGLTFTMTYLRNMGTYQTGPITFRVEPNDDFSYSVITLNYDLVLETICRHINETFRNNGRHKHADESDQIEFERNDEEDAKVPFLAKLHGSVDVPGIIPPTWNKSLHKGIVREWQLAFRLLKEANHLRVLGYSLPVADSYIKYLLKSAIIDNKNFKSFDVICRDGSGDVAQRYAALLKFPLSRFVSGDLSDYAKRVSEYAGKDARSVREDPRSFRRSSVVFDSQAIEIAHESFIQDPSPRLPGVIYQHSGL